MLLSHNHHRARSILFCLLISVAGLELTPTVLADNRDPGASKFLPDDLGTYKANEKATAVIDSSTFGAGSMMRAYTSGTGSQFVVQIKNAENDSAAFALLTRARLLLSPTKDMNLDDVGTASFDLEGGVIFCKGLAFIAVRPVGGGSLEEAKDLGRKIATPVEADEEDVPVLVKHLPDWQSAVRRAVYCVTLDGLSEATHGPGASDLNKQSKPTASSPTPSVFDALDFAGGTEAVVANYGPSLLIIVEFTTPQMSIDNDSRIWTRIAELKPKGEPTPTAYRRVGNYSVFVFNAPDEKTANALVDQVKYEQVVQWLGDDPHLYEKMQRYLTQTSAGVLVAVLKSSGLSLVFCLAIGGVIGALLFRHRRAQRAAAFSDAGGSIRLNLDELTDPSSSRRLLPAKETGKDPAS